MHLFLLLYFNFINFFLIISFRCNNIIHEQKKYEKNIGKLLDEKKLNLSLKETTENRI